MAIPESTFKLRKDPTTNLVNEKSQQGNGPIIMLCLATVAVFSNMYATQPILPVIGQEFGLQPSEAGLTVSSMVLAVAFSAVFYGVLSDLVGRRPVIIGSTFALSIPTFLCGVAPNFLFLIICRIAQGLLIPGFVAITITYLHEEFSERRGMVVGWYTSASVLGGFTGRLQGGLMTEFVSWRFAFITFGLLNLLAAVSMVKFLPLSRNFFRQEKAPEDLGASWRGLYISSLLACLKNRRLLGTYFIGPAIFFPFIGLFTYLPYYLTRPPFNLSTLLVSFIFVVYLIGLFAPPVCGILGEKFGHKNIMGLGVALIFAGALLTLVPSLPVVFMALLILCFGMFSTQSTANAFIGDSVGKGQGRGSAVSLYQMFFYLGGSLGGFIPGLLWQSEGWFGLVAGCLVWLGIGYAAARWLWR